MTDKIQSALIEIDAPTALRAKYEEIYRSSRTWLYAKSQGVHSAIAHLLGSMADGATILDVGCGAGRLSLMLSHRAAHVDAFDFSQTAVDIARLNVECTGTRNVTVTEATLESFVPTASYDVIVLVGTLEHLPDPLAGLKRLHSFLRPGGALVVSCPGFLNFRGHVYMTLLSLLDLPMSLADLRQVYPWDVSAWAGACGFTLERTAGALYRFGWDEKASQDLSKRIPAALRDKAIDVSALDLPRLDAWLAGQVPATRAYLDGLVARKILRRLEPYTTLQLHQVTTVPEALWTNMEQYINEDLSADPYWCTEEPFSLHGGETIYLLRAVRS